jgi:hypothetical protein
MNTPAEIETPAVPEYLVTVGVGDGGDANFEFTFRLDGTGSCKDIDFGSAPIGFTWEPSASDGMEGEARNEALRELAEDLFWEEINDQLDEDRVLQSIDYGSEEVTFETGSGEELEKLVRLILYSFPSIWEEGRDDIDVTIFASTECEGAGIDDYCELMEDAAIADEIKTAIRELAAYALGWNSPAGAHLEYNDGAAGRASGYSEIPNTVWFSVPRPSFHELAEARERLLAIFADHEARDEAEQLLHAEE